MDINLIAAIGKNNELGKNGNLIWNLKEDMEFFKNTTMGHTIVMGRKTFESLPKILPGRTNVVISTSGIRSNEIELYKSIKEFLTHYKNFNDDIFIIGGASLYKEFISIATRMYLTEIDSEDKFADTYFPKFNVNEWEREELSTHEENNISFSHVLYKRKN